MLDLHAPLLPAGPGERLTRDAYRSDFKSRRYAVRNSDSWKLERRQHFEEIGDPSREALRRGQWDEALRLIEAARDSRREAALDDFRRGSAFHRVRVVEEPLTPYVQWELHSLRMSAECGHLIRVIPATAVTSSETHGLLPELTVLNDRVLYRVLYDEAGRPDGAVRYTDTGIVSRWSAYVREVYAAGEDLLSYFDRAVAHLPPPPPA
jgi:hypothetical protein